MYIQKKVKIYKKQSGIKNTLHEEGACLYIKEKIFKII